MSELLSTTVYFCNSIIADKVFKSRGVLLDMLRRKNVRVYKEFIENNISECTLYYRENENFFDKENVYYGRGLNNTIGVPVDDVCFFSDGALSIYELEIDWLLSQRIAKPYEYITNTIDKPNLKNIFTDISYDIRKEIYFTRINSDPNFDGEYCDGPVFFPYDNSTDNIFCGRAVVDATRICQNWGRFTGRMYLGEFCSLDEISKYISKMRDSIKRTFNTNKNRELDLIQMCFPYLIGNDKSHIIRFAYIDNLGKEFVTVRIFYKEDGKIKFGKYEMKKEQYDKYIVGKTSITFTLIIDNMQLK